MMKYYRDFMSGQSGNSMLGLDWLGNYKGHVWVSCFYKRGLEFIGAPKGKWGFCRQI
jgi:hypothetical protein